MKTHCLRLTRGADLYLSLKDYCDTQKIDAAVVLSAVGSLSCAVLRCAGALEIVSLTEPLELCSLSGTLSQSRLHLHTSLSRRDLSVIGGHVKVGCTVDTTMELVIAELEGTRFLSQWDESTGYNELLIVE